MYFLKCVDLIALCTVIRAFKKADILSVAVLLKVV